MPRARFTKIVATVGPATSSRERLRALFNAGADVFRLNFSHGTHEDHKKRLTELRVDGGASANDLVPLGQAVARGYPSATVVSVEAPHPSELGRGKEWFSVLGVTEQNRPERVAAAMSLFLKRIRHWQKAAAVGPAQTVLLGFSQGSIMSLESTQHVDTSVPDEQAAHCVIALAGRFAQPVRRAPTGVRIHLIHGQADSVVPTRCSVEAYQQLSSLQARVTLDLIPNLGHGIDAQAIGHVMDRLALK